MSKVQADTSAVFGPGDTILFPKRQLSTIIQYPKDGQPYKCILMILKNDRLKGYYARNLIQDHIERSPAIHGYPRHPLLESYFASLLPYFDLQEDLPATLLSLK
jgi:hypothetical protein